MVYQGVKEQTLTSLSMLSTEWHRQDSDKNSSSTSLQLQSHSACSSSTTQNKRRKKFSTRKNDVQGLNQESLSCEEVNSLATTWAALTWEPKALLRLTLVWQYKLWKNKGIHLGSATVQFQLVTKKAYNSIDKDWGWTKDRRTYNKTSKE